MEASWYTTIYFSHSWLIFWFHLYCPGFCFLVSSMDHRPFCNLCQGFLCFAISCSSLHSHSIHVSNSCFLSPPLFLICQSCREITELSKICFTVHYCIITAILLSISTRGPRLLLKCRRQLRFSNFSQICFTLHVHLMCFTAVQILYLFFKLINKGGCFNTNS